MGKKEGIIIPKAEYLSKLFMRKSGLPVLKVRFPDGTVTGILLPTNSIQPSYSSRFAKYCMVCQTGFSCNYTNK
jgi:hypothetical protein